MKNTLSKLAIIGAMALSVASALAQTQLKVSTGAPTGTYSIMFNQFQKVCKNQILQIEIPSKGSIENMDRILGNEVNAAIIQTDVLYFRARNEDLSGIKTLFALHPEEVHVITSTVSQIMEGGTLGIGKKPAQFKRVEDLAGRPVAVWGGSTITAQVIKLQGDVNFIITEVADFKTAKAALDSGAVAALIMVGGQPMPDVSALSNAYKFLPFDPATVSKLKSVYVPAKLNYSGMGLGGAGVTTIATEALFITRAYKSAKYVESLSALRGCYMDNLEMMQEETGYHKKWSAVKAENTGKWPYYTFPEASVKTKK